MTPCWAKGFQLVAFVDRWLTNTSTISTYPRIGWMAAVGCAGCPHVDIFWQQHFPTRILHNLYNIIYIFTTHWFYQQWRRRWSADPRWIHHCPIWRYMPLGWNSGSRCASKILGILDIWGPVQISDPSAMLIILFIWIIWVWEWRNSKYPKRFVREVGPGHGKSFFWQTYMHPYISIQIHTYIYIYPYNIKYSCIDMWDVRSITRQVLSGACQPLLMYEIHSAGLGDSRCQLYMVTWQPKKRGCDVESN